MDQTPGSTVFLPSSRGDHLRRLSAESVDILIVGGGINGCGIARDLALRSAAMGIPLKIAVVEQNQFGSGTSGRNSQLIHGGLRYLKNLEFRLVREALNERATLMRLAPRLVEPLPFLLPFYGRLAGPYYGAGLWLYDMLAGSTNIARHKRLTREEVLKLEPGLDSRNLCGGALFHDCRVHSTRLVLANLLDACSRGAVAVNHVRAETFWRDKRRGWRVGLHDLLTGDRLETWAAKVVDATGPWGRKDALRLVRGSHLVLPRVTSGGQAIAHFEEAGRIVFLVPWGEEANLTLLGTTDVDHSGSPDDVAPSRDEIDYLMRVAGRLFPAALRTEPVAAFSSLRPLVRDDEASPHRTSREHRIWNSGDGTLHVAGGKYTTYRLMSEEAADMALADVRPELQHVHLTAETPLAGCSAEDVERLSRGQAERAAQAGLSSGEYDACVRCYGARIEAFLGCLPATAPPGLSRLEAARISYAARHEMAMRLADCLFVSTYRGYERAWDAASLAPYAERMADELGWQRDRIDEEIRSCLRPVTGKQAA